MRHCALVIAASVLVLPAAVAAQEYAGRAPKPPTTVLRPAETVAWRNYVTVPDGPCGCPMSVEADCYNGCPHHCNPIRRVRRMLDCLLPCNLCCGGGGLFHGCQLGGRHGGGCSICCGTACSGGCGGNCGGGCGGNTGGHGGCCLNPAGSVFDSYAPSCGCATHQMGCSTTVPMLSDPFQDDPLPPKPTTQPATEVRRAPVQQRMQPVARAQGTGVRQAVVHQSAASRPVVSQAVKPQPQVVQGAVRPGPYKIVNAPGVKPNVSRAVHQPGAAKVAPAANVERGGSTQSVLRRASAEEEQVEPATLKVDHARAVPLVLTQEPSEGNRRTVPSNPLR